MKGKALQPTGDVRERPRRGFSLIELLVVTGMIVVLASIFVPYLLSWREGERRVRCADNLRALREALVVYAAANGGNFPRVIYDPKSPNAYTAFTGVDAGKPFAGDGAGPAANDVTASLWLLVRAGLVGTGKFICPSRGDVADSITDARGLMVNPTQRGNFRSGANLSYSYASPFSAAPGFRLNDTQPSEFVILADKNPGTAGANDDVVGPSVNSKPFELAKANSNNHGKAGQNVLHADGHVSFQASPYCGYGGDNIYTALAPTPLPGSSNPPPNVQGNGVLGKNVQPAWWGDSYLVPTDDGGG